MSTKAHSVAGLVLLCLTGCGLSDAATAPMVEPLFSVGLPSGEIFNAQLARSGLPSVSCHLGVCEIESVGSGAANIMGPITFSAHVVQDFTALPCPTVIATLDLVGRTGSISLADVAGTACPLPGPETVPAWIFSEWEVIGGTGEFAGIEGSGTSSGPIVSQGPRVHVRGSVAY